MIINPIELYKWLTQNEKLTFCIFTAKTINNKFNETFTAVKKQFNEISWLLT